MKKKVTIYFSPVVLEVELADNLNNYEIEEEINRQVYDIQVDDITAQTAIDYWEYWEEGE